MQMKHLLLLASLLTCMGAGAQQATFRNPVIAGDMADPTVIRVDNTYYATGTSSEWAPYYPLFRSKDLVNWRQIGHLFEQQPAWTRSVLGPGTFPPQRQNIRLLYGTPENRRDVVYRRRHGRQTRRPLYRPRPDRRVRHRGDRRIRAGRCRRAVYLVESLLTRPKADRTPGLQNLGRRAAHGGGTLHAAARRQTAGHGRAALAENRRLLLHRLLHKRLLRGPGSDYAVAVARSTCGALPSVTPGTRSCTAAAMSSPSGTAPSRRRPTGGCSTSATPIWPVRISF